MYVKANVSILYPQRVYESLIGCGSFSVVFHLPSIQSYHLQIIFHVPFQFLELG